MLVNNPSASHMQPVRAMIPMVYHHHAYPHLYRQSMPPVVATPYQRFQIVSTPVYAAMNIQ